MAGPFDRTGINQSTPVEQEALQGTTPGRGNLFGPSSTTSIVQSEGVDGTVSDGGVLFGPTDDVTTVQANPTTGTYENSGSLFGDANQISVQATTSSGGGEPVSAVDVDFDEITRILTTRVDSLSDTVVIPSDATPVSDVDVAFDDATRTLTTTVNGVTDTAVIPGGGGGGGTQIGISASPISDILTADQATGYEIDAPTGEAFAEETIVFVNGIKWREDNTVSSSSYSRTTSTITFNCPLSSGDEIEINPIQPITEVNVEANASVTETLTANQATGHVVNAPTGETFSTSSIVFVNGIEWEAGTSSYTIATDGSTVTFNCPLRSGDILKVIPRVDFSLITGGGGTTVAANPGGTELTALETITIGDTSYALAGGVEVKANPGGTGNTDLTSITIGSVNYDLAGNIENISDLEDVDVSQPERVRYQLNSDSGQVIDTFFTALSDGIQMQVPDDDISRTVGQFVLASNPFTVLEYTPAGVRTDRAPFQANIASLNSAFFRFVQGTGLMNTFLYQLQITVPASDTPTAYEEGHLLTWRNSAGNWVTEESGHIQWQSTSVYVEGDTVTYEQQLWIATRTTTEGLEPAATNTEWSVIPTDFNSFPSINVGSPEVRVLSDIIPFDTTGNEVAWNAGAGTFTTARLNSSVPYLTPEQIAAVDLTAEYGVTSTVASGVVLGPFMITSITNVEDLAFGRFTRQTLTVNVAGDTAGFVGNRPYSIGIIDITPGANTPGSARDGYGLTWDNTTERWIPSRVVSLTDLQTAVDASESFAEFKQAIAVLT